MIDPIRVIKYIVSTCKKVNKRRESKIESHFQNKKETEINKHNESGISQNEKLNTMKILKLDLLENYITR